MPGNTAKRILEVRNSKFHIGKSTPKIERIILNESKVSRSMEKSVNKKKRIFLHTEEYSEFLQMKDR